MSIAERLLGRCLWRKDTSPNPSRNVGGFRNSPHTPLKRPKGGGCGPLLWKPPQGESAVKCALLNGRGIQRGGIAIPPLCVVSRWSGGKSKSPRVSLLGGRGNRRSAASGGCSEVVSRKRHDWRPRTVAGNRIAATVGKFFSFQKRKPPTCLPRHCQWHKKTPVVFHGGLFRFQ